MSVMLRKFGSSVVNRLAFFLTLSVAGCGSGIGQESGRPRIDDRLREACPGSDGQIESLINLWEANKAAGPPDITANEVINLALINGLLTCGPRDPGCTIAAICTIAIINRVYP